MDFKKIEEKLIRLESIRIDMCVNICEFKDLIEEISCAINNNPLMTFGKHSGKPIDQLPESYISWLFLTGVLDKNENIILKEQLKNLTSKKENGI